MNGELYFEEHPWARCCSTIAQRNLGPIHEIAIQAVCSGDAVEACFALWLQRCEALLGGTIPGETLKAKNVISFVGSIGECVVRIFIDANSGEETENFEIVTGKALIVWKPGTSLQGRHSTGYTCARQQYVADLEVKA